MRGQRHLPRRHRRQHDEAPACSGGGAAGVGGGGGRACELRPGEPLEICQQRCLAVPPSDQDRLESSGGEELPLVRRRHSEVPALCGCCPTEAAEIAGEQAAGSARVDDGEAQALLPRPLLGIGNRLGCSSKSFVHYFALLAGHMTNHEHEDVHIFQRTFERRGGQPWQILLVVHKESIFFRLLQRLVLTCPVSVHIGAVRSRRVQHQGIPRIWVKLQQRHQNRITPLVATLHVLPFAARSNNILHEVQLQRVRLAEGIERLEREPVRVERQSHRGLVEIFHNGCQEKLLLRLSPPEARHCRL
mmetsp:Transcript_77301/g.196359  ORF Transcript_77301/g.196359 Transcript_77301/m.196359 type:complete len:303 (+) Transcript_77301:348-1256(+)